MNIMNEQLESLYGRAWAMIKNHLSSDLGLSNPHFIFVPDLYVDTAIKVMFVGQQTNGWGVNEGGYCGKELGANPVKTLMELYKGFKFGEKYKRSPFWQATRKLFKLLHSTGLENSFIWSNLVKIDQCGKRPSYEIEDKISELKLLQEEITITKPDIIIFFTGPDYDERLKKLFINPCIEFSPIENLPIKMLSRLRHRLLPAKCIRTYHPSYLRQSKQWNLLEQIAENLKKNN